MSKRAEEKASERYPQEDRIGIAIAERSGFICGYDEAEKDIISLVESRLSELLGDAQPTPILRYDLRDLVKKIGKQ